MPGTDPGSISYAGINDATNVLMAGRASMMMKWPFMWNAAQDPRSRRSSASSPARSCRRVPAGSASIDGTDAWTVSKTSADPTLAPPTRQNSISMPTCRSGRPSIRVGYRSDCRCWPTGGATETANAAVVLEQAKYPYNSFVTPDFNQVTQSPGDGNPEGVAGAEDGSAGDRRRLRSRLGNREAPRLIALMLSHATYEQRRDPRACYCSRQPSSCLRDPRLSHLGIARSRLSEGAARGRWRRPALRRIGQLPTARGQTTHFAGPS